VIAIDTNILVYAHRAESPFFPQASRCVTELAEGAASWAIAWPCIHEFLGIVTHPRIHKPPTPVAIATEQVEVWMDSPKLVLLGESGGHWRTLREMLLAGRIAGPRIHDARIAAICQQHGVRELWSADRDFSRFPGLRTRNPLRPD
jgi:toxin-antitoxin system PIN domain toxin